MNKSNANGEKRMNNDEFWETVLKEVSGKISSPSYETWFKNTSGFVENDLVIVTTRTKEVAAWLECRYSTLLSEITTNLTGKEYMFKFYSSEIYDPTSTSIEFQEDRIDSLRDRVKEVENRVRNLEPRIHEIEQGELPSRYEKSNIFRLRRYEIRFILDVYKELFTRFEERTSVVLACSSFINRLSLDSHYVTANSEKYWADYISREYECMTDMKQLYFWSSEWQEMINVSLQDLKEGCYTSHCTVDSLIKELGMNENKHSWKDNTPNE